MSINTFLNSNSTLLKTDLSNISSNGKDNIVNIVQTAIDDGDIDVDVAVNIDLNDLNDVVLTTPATGNVLYKTGTNWVNQTLGPGDITGLTATLALKMTNPFGATKNEMIRSNGANTFTTVGAPVNTGDVLTYDGVADDLKWLAPQAGVTTLHGLQDVLTDEPPADKSFLMYNPSNGTGVDGFWVNSSAQMNDISDIVLTTPVNGNILSYNGTSWLNSARLSTLETTVTNQGNQIANLGSWSATQPSPVTSPQTISLNQTTYPIIRSTYTAFAGLVPLDENGVDASGNVLYLNTGTANGTGPWNVNGGAVYGGGKTSQQQRQTFFRLIPNDLAAIQANYNSNTLWIDSNVGSVGDGKGVIKVNYVYNNLPIGTYTFKSLNRGVNSPDKVRIYGCKNFNQAFITTFIADRTYTLPTVGVDYDLIYQNLTRTTTVGTIDVNITTTAVYSAIGIYFEAPTGGLGLCGASIMTTQTLTDTLTVGLTGTNVTYSNTSGSMIITRNSAIAGESWNISYTLLSFWYLHNVVMGICRNPNTVNLSNTVINDSRVSINNAGNNFAFNNAANTTTYLFIDVANDAVRLPRNSWTMAYIQEVILLRNINNNGIFVFFNYGNTADGLTVVQPAAAKSAFTWDNANNRFQFATAGTYHIQARMSFFGNDPVDEFDLCLRNPDDNSIYPGSITYGNMLNGRNYTFSMNFITDVPTAARFSFAMRITVGAILPFNYIVKGFSITATNLLTS